jgi:hypothetical protein
MQGMNHDQLLAQEEIYRAHVLICRERGLSVEESVRALADQAARRGVELHDAALSVLGRSAAGKELPRHHSSVEADLPVDFEAHHTSLDRDH